MSFRRLLTGIAAAFALSLVLAVASASARTVYDYEYSGTFFDGSGAGKTFTTGLGGVVFDPTGNYFLVANSGEPGWVTKLNPSGNGINFSELGAPFAVPAGTQTALSQSQVAIDESGGATDGRFYATSGSAIHGFKPSGTETPFVSGTGFIENLCGVYVTPDGEEVVAAGREGLEHYKAEDGEPTHSDRVVREGVVPGVKVLVSERNRPCHPVLDSNGNIFGIKPGGFGSNFNGKVIKVRSDGLEEFELNQIENTRGVAVDQSTDDVFALQTNFSSGSFELFDNDGRYLGGGWGGPEGPYEGITRSAFGITVEPTTHDVWIANLRNTYAGEVTHVEKFVRTNPHVIPDVTALDPHYEHPTGEIVKIAGTVNPDGVETTACYFEYGLTEALGTQVPCEQGNNFSGSSDQEVTAKISTPKGKLYFYKLFSKNGNEQITSSNEKRFVPQGKPISEYLAVDRVNTDGARLTAKFDPNGGPTTFHFEWGVKGEGFTNQTEESKYFGYFSEGGLFSGEDYWLPGSVTEAQTIGELQPGTTYEYRAVFTNAAGTTMGSAQEFTTYVPDPGTDPCANAQVRQQTEASLLPDCRAYEQVSAQNTGGYDVESDLVSTQTPLTAYPRANDSLLYSIHFGVIPGVTGSPTNNGPDPYLARRGPTGWSTSYVGVPANGMADEGAFGSPLLGADSSLSTFAFGGQDICDPCYADGSINIPLRKPDGSLVKGMAGSLNPAADPTGEVRKPLSDDGTHLIFGSDQVFESAAEGGGAMWIYSRNLVTNTTQLVSTTPGGAPISGEVAELDVSSDGSRVLIGKVVGEDGAGNRYYDLYMHDGTNPNSIEVADTASGVIFNGMTDDGTKVFFTTPDALAGDGDTSADMYRADVGGSVTRISTGTGGTGNTDACEPVTDWNVSEGGPDCSVVAFAGGAGVAAGDGTAYFVSPEKLDGAGNGEQNEANLYVVKPGGSPQFVAVLDSSAYKPPPAPPKHVLGNGSFASGLSSPGELAVDQNSGEVYVTERGGANRVSRFTAAGEPSEFSALGSNKLTGQSLGGNGEGQIAVDSSGSPFEGSLYVTTNGGAVRVYAHSGEKLGEITGFGEACGVSVDQANGDVYVGNYSNRIYRFKPVSAATPVTNANYEAKEEITAADSLCNIANGPEYVYSWPYNGGPVKQRPKSAFMVGGSTPASTPIGSGVHTGVDPVNGDVYVNETSKISRYDSSGNLLEVFGDESLSGSRGVAVNATTDRVYATTALGIQEFTLFTPPYEPIDNPGVVHGVQQAGVHSYEDLQVTPDGRYAVFGTVGSLTGYQSEGHTELFRYDSVSDSIACASCAPTGAIGGSDVSLSNIGLNLADDGRVFFTTLESFTLRDTNEKTDAYEWNEGKVGLISPGIGPDDSGLVTVSADGKDAFFFTRDSLVQTDQSGNVVKIYDAREGGGYAFDPPRQLCKASDECHGAGTQAPGPPNINTVTGAGKASSAANNQCQNLGRRARKNSNQAKRLRGKAKKAHGKRAKALRRKAKRSAKQARKLSKKAKSCRRSRGNG